jgi:hypothetical protein
MKLKEILKYINEKSTSILVEILSVGLILFVGYLLFLNNSHGLETFNNGDVHRGFQRGINVLNGINSYLEFNPDQMLMQEKVPGFFPLYFHLMAVIARISNYSFVLFLDNLRSLVFTAYLSIGLFIYFYLRKQSKLLGVFGMALFMFNRWTLGDVYNLKQDTYVLFPLLISLWQLQKDNVKNKIVAYLLFGVATAVKHLTIFAAPVYALFLVKPFFQFFSNWDKELFLKKLARFVLYIFILVLPILGPSIPYILDTPRHYKNAIMYNLTREGESKKNLGTGFDNLLVLYNQDRNNTNFYYMLPRAPMFIVFLLLVIALFIGKINVWKYCAFAYLIFVIFNPVIFGQYYVWFLAFAPLVLMKENRINTKLS